MFAVLILYATVCNPLSLTCQQQEVVRIPVPNMFDCQAAGMNSGKPYTCIPR